MYASLSAHGWISARIELLSFFVKRKYQIYNARYYEAEIGRFITADNVIDGEYSTQGWNRFSYVKNNPVRYKDPSGHSKKDAEAQALASVGQITERHYINVTKGGAGTLPDNFEEMREKQRTGPQSTQKRDNSQRNLMTYTNDRYRGETIKCDSEFKDSLDKINQYAEDSDVYLHITDSFRKEGQPVNGAVVPPAARSNHKVGHAIDMNIIHNGTLYNANAMNNYNSLPNPVKQFINSIRHDPDLRWGGDFNPIDSVHIDDGYNQNSQNYDRKYRAIQREAQSN